MEMKHPTNIELIPLSDLLPYATNPRTHSAEQVDKIAASIREFGWTNPVLIDSAGTIIAGHGRVMAARKLGIEAVPCLRLGHLTKAQVAAYVIADNRLSEIGGSWDEEMLAAELERLKETGFELTGTGFTDAEIAAIMEGTDGGVAAAPSPSMADRFGVPPFSVLNARDRWWMDRKRAWLGIGIRSELGRGENALIKSLSGRVPGYYLQKTKAEEKVGRKLTNEEFERGHLVIPDGHSMTQSGTSVFDPVLVEIACRWFCPAGGTIIDPFAGGSVRGVVASRLGYQYVGHELRPEQVEANREQAAELCADCKTPPRWIAGDSRNILQTCDGVGADMLLTCPPYADLEVYSDDPADLSGMGYPEFRDAYRDIVAKSCRLLEPDSFAVVVVGEVRGTDGSYRGFVPDTVNAFVDAGLGFYNEAVLLTPVGSLPIRAGGAFVKSRKLGKTHQNVLVFCKGNGKRAAERCGHVEIDPTVIFEHSDEESLPVLPE